MTYHIVARIPEKCGDKYDKHQQMDIERDSRQRRYRPRYEKERVTWKKRSHHQTRLAEDHEKKYGVSPHMIITDNLHHIPVDMQDQIDYEFYKFHSKTLINIIIQPARTLS